MPQPTQNFLIHILLLWTTVISIIQIVIVILFFTAGHKGLDSSAVQSSKISSTERRSTTTAPCNPGLSIGKMISYKFSTDGGIIKLISDSDESLISRVDNGLSVNVDGYYFINLQVTLSPKTDCPITNKTKVSLVRIREDTEKPLLEGSINKETYTTGILSKVVQCGAGEKLIVRIEPLYNVDDTESKTHLDVIYMSRPEI